MIAPTRLYVRSLLALQRARPGLIKGLAHITGGGLTGNIPRILPEHLTARIDAQAWTLPPLFRWLQEAGQVPTDEMHRVFNCGIGMVLICAAQDADEATRLLLDAGERVFRLGNIDTRQGIEPQTILA